MAHAQPWVAATLGVGRGAAEVLHQEEREPFLCRRAVVGKHGPQQRIGVHSAVKGVDKPAEGVFAQLAENGQAAIKDVNAHR